jgi:predicted RNA binding protein YcfA (HicA-like mRNA interferase family)
VALTTPSEPLCYVARLSESLREQRFTVVAMAPLRRPTGRELLAALQRLGWQVVAQRGSHAQLRHPTRDGRVTLPLHAGETIGPRLLHTVLVQAGMSVDELRDAL